MMTEEEKKKKNAQRSKKWREAHPDYMKKYMQEYRPEHLEEMRENDRRYHAEHREENNKKRREWARLNPEKDKAATDRWRAEHPDHLKNYWLMKNYGLSLDQYNEKLLAQGGVCAICKGLPNRNGHKYFHVDHDHKTGTVRKLLCHRCNTMLGLAKDNAQILEAATEYLKIYLTDGAIVSE